MVQLFRNLSKDLAWNDRPAVDGPRELFRWYIRWFIDDIYYGAGKTDPWRQWVDLVVGPEMRPQFIDKETTPVFWGWPKLWGSFGVDMAQHTTLELLQHTRQAFTERQLNGSWLWMTVTGRCIWRDFMQSDEFMNKAAKLLLEHEVHINVRPEDVRVGFGWWCKIRKRGYNTLRVTHNADMPTGTVVKKL
jgi:hypothetical protein